MLQPHSMVEHVFKMRSSSNHAQPVSNLVVVVGPRSINSPMERWTGATIPTDCILYTDSKSK